MSRLSHVRNAQREAFDRLGGRYDVRVLEPSPPAVGEGPWFADDPVARGDVPADAVVVSPVSNGDLMWDDLARDDAELAPWCAERWLGAWRPLREAPAALAETRVALHRLAEHVMSPARVRVNGKIALRHTFAGFGTPFYGDDVQVRVEAAELVLQDATEDRRERITTLRAAAELAGVELGVEDEPLAVDAAASRWLGDWYGFGASVLEELRACNAGLEPSRVQLWPEHFDIATELGSEAHGLRAGYGASPGDELHEEPYLYVVPWAPERADGELWNATAFRGAELSLSALLAREDQRGAALEFFRERIAALAA